MTKAKIRSAIRRLIINGMTNKDRLLTEVATFDPAYKVVLQMMDSNEILVLGTVVRLNEIKYRRCKHCHGTGKEKY